MLLLAQMVLKVLSERLRLQPLILLEGSLLRLVNSLELMSSTFNSANTFATTCSKRPLFRLFSNKVHAVDVAAGAGGEAGCAAEMSVLDDDVGVAAAGGGLLRVAPGSCGADGGSADAFFCGVSSGIEVNLGGGAGIAPSAFCFCRMCALPLT